MPCCTTDAEPCLRGELAAERADVAPRELACGRRGRSRVSAGRSRRPARVPALAAARGAGPFRRSRQQSARARRRVARHRRLHALGAARASRSRDAADGGEITRRGRRREPESRALRGRCTISSAPSSSRAFPGTIGGALAMNAGCYGGETWDIVRTRDDGRSRRRAARAHARRTIASAIARCDALPADRERRAGLGDAAARGLDEWFVRRVFALPRGDGARSRQQVKDAARAAHREPAARRAERGLRVPQPARGRTRRG